MSRDSVTPKTYRMLSDRMAPVLTVERVTSWRCFFHSVIWQGNSLVGAQCIMGGCSYTVWPPWKLASDRGAARGARLPLWCHQTAFRLNENCRRDLAAGEALAALLMKLEARWFCWNSWGDTKAKIMTESQDHYNPAGMYTQTVSIWVKGTVRPKMKIQSLSQVWIKIKDSHTLTHNLVV